MCSGNYRQGFHNSFSPFLAQTGSSGPGLSEGGYHSCFPEFLATDTATHLLLFHGCGSSAQVEHFPSLGYRQAALPTRPGSIVRHLTGGLPTPGGPACFTYKAPTAHPPGVEHSLAPAGTWGLPPGTGACSPFTRDSGTVLGEKSRETGVGWLLVAWPRSVTRMPLWNSVTPGAWGVTGDRGHP